MLKLWMWAYVYLLQLSYFYFFWYTYIIKFPSRLYIHLTSLTLVNRKQFCMSQTRTIQQILYGFRFYCYLVACCCCYSGCLTNISEVFVYLNIVVAFVFSIVILMSSACVQMLFSAVFHFYNMHNIRIEPIFIYQLYTY